MHGVPQWGQIRLQEAGCSPGASQLRMLVEEAWYLEKERSYLAALPPPRTGRVQGFRRGVKK